MKQIKTWNWPMCPSECAGEAIIEQIIQLRQNPPLTRCSRLLTLCRINFWQYVNKQSIKPLKVCVYVFGGGMMKG